MEQSQFQNDLQIIPDPIFLIGADGIVHNLNIAAEKVLGKTEKEVCGVPLVSLVSSSSENVETFLKGFHQNHEGNPEVISFFDSNGETKEFCCYADFSDFSNDSNKNFIVLRCIEKTKMSSDCSALNQKIEKLNQDLFRRRFVEKSLRNSMTQFRTILDTAAEAIYGLDLEGNCTFCNKACLEILGYLEISDLLGKNMHDLIQHTREDGTRYPYRECKISHVDRCGKAIQVDHEILWRADESHFIAECRVTPLVEDDDVVGSVVTFRDITARKKAEKIMKERTQLIESRNAALAEAARSAEMATKEKSEFLASMSHELRTPLNAIIGFSEGLLERTAKHPLNDHQKDRLGKIKKSGEHLLGLINGILDLAKIETGKIDIRLDIFDVATLVGELEDMGDALLKDKPNVQLIVDVESNVGEIASDRSIIKQIIINLLGNAAKFTEQGSITLRAFQDDSFLHISVRDTGYGVSPENLPKIFGKFDQVREANEKAIKGTGLGLTISRTFADRLAGTISVRSVEGVGSTFTLSLPIHCLWDLQLEPKEMIENLRKENEENRIDNGKPTVLCIEDQPLQMQLLKDIFSDSNYRMVMAFDASEGLSVARATQPDIITLDFMLPGMNGCHLFKQLRAFPETAEIPVVVLSALDIRSLCGDIAADDQLIKPVTKKRLLESIERVLAEKRRSRNSEKTNLTPVH